MKSLQALLIGIDRHDPNPWCGDLYGAVADMEAMRAFLLDGGVPARNVRCLASRRPAAASGAGTVAEEETLPTHGAMVEAIVALGERAAAAGGGALIHYSGHGGRARTWLPGVKGSGGRDEGLVPCDVGPGRARLLRDVELTWLIHRMALRGVPVTVILDACHSGGLTRDASGLRRRSARGLFGDLAPGDRMVAPLPELERVWRWVHHRASATLDVPARKSLRHGRAHGGWVSAGLLGSPGVVLLSACRSHELAYERDFGGGPRGTLTHGLLEILIRDGRERSWQSIHRRLARRLGQLSPPQRPMLEGDVGTGGPFSEARPSEVPCSAAAPRHPDCFLALRDLDDAGANSELRGALTAGIGLLSPGYRRGDPLDVQSLDPADRPRIPAGRWIALDVANRYHRPLHFLVFDLRPDRSVEILFGAAMLERGEQVRLPIETYLPCGHQGGAETLRVIATLEPTTLGALRLSALSREIANAASTATPAAVLMRRLGRGGGRRFRGGRPKSPGWTTARVDFEVP